MNRRMVFNIIGKILQTEAALLIVPIITAVCYRETDCLKYFLLTALAVFAAGLLISRFTKPKNTVIYAKEGFVIVAASWIVMSLTSAIPFCLTGDIPNYIDAVFETVSGFTTTGASILDNVEAMHKSTLLWRGFTHWVGGMGVLVFVMAILPSATERSLYIMRAEVPGPSVGKLVPRARTTARILYLIYVGFTLLQIILLLAGGMSLFDSLFHAFATAGTGGFGMKADSVGSYSPYLQWVITIFMLIYGVNFNLYYFLLIKKWKTVAKSTELWVYVGFFVVSTAIISANVFSLYGNLNDTVRTAAFQVSSVITTTGFSTVNFDLWPSLSKSVLLLLMFTGACAGSTAGGFKLSRVILVCKMARREFKRLLHPRSTNSIRFEGKTVDEQTLGGVSMYLIIYLICFISVFLLISFQPFSIETNFSAALSCFNNIGPAFGAAGPALSYSGYSYFGKIVLSAAMLLGRLEIYPLIIAFSPSTWSRK